MHFTTHPEYKNDGPDRATQPESGTTLIVFSEGIDECAIYEVAQVIGDKFGEDTFVELAIEIYGIFKRYSDLQTGQKQEPAA